MPKSKLLGRARNLRRESTTPERRLWACLSGRRLSRWKWKRQVPKGPYILDFYCADAALVVEVDGSQHEQHRTYDERRTEWLHERGLFVLRFWNPEIAEELEAVCRAVENWCALRGASSSRR